jgi:hypothetical protein
MHLDDPGRGRGREPRGARGRSGIELIGHGSDPTRIERWTFSEITEDSFLWRGDVSRDDGQTWRLIQEMHATRQASADS